MEITTLKTHITSTVQQYLNQFWSLQLIQNYSINLKEPLYITGSGAGYGVARTVLCFEQTANLKILPQIDFNYQTSDHLSGTLILIDLDGLNDETERSLSIAKANHMNTILITSKDSTCCFKNSDICINIPANSLLYEWNTYFAAQIFLFSIISLQLIEAKKLSIQQFETIGSFIENYASTLVNQLDSIYSSTLVFANSVAYKKQLDLISDYCLDATSEYIRSLYCRTGGYLCSVNDSEEWCHVNFWCLHRHDIATIATCPESAPSFSRFKETMMTVHRIERPYLIITDASPEVFYPDTTICKVPQIKEIYWIFASLFFPIPALIALKQIQENREKEASHE